MEGLSKDEMQQIARTLTGQSLHAFFRTSQRAHNASQNHINEVQNLPNNEYLSAIFSCDNSSVIDQTMAAVVEFINYNVPQTKFTDESLAGAIRLHIANHIHPKTIRELMRRFQACHTLIGSQSILRMNATVGMPNMQTHNLSEYQLSIALTMVAVSLSFICPLDKHTNVANLIDNWIVYRIHHNKESMRLAENVALQIRYWTEPNVLRLSPSSKM